MGASESRDGRTSWSSGAVKLFNSHQMETMPNAALYLRVSTDRQITDNQLEDVRRLAIARGYEPELYEETESAVKARPVLDRMMSDVRAGRVQAVAVWALDRLHRSMTGAI